MKKLVELIAEENYNEAGKFLNEMTAKKIVDIIDQKKQKYIDSVRKEYAK